MMKHTYLYGCLLLALAGCVKHDKEASGKLDKIDAAKTDAVVAADDPNDIMSFYSFMETPTNGTFGALVHAVEYNRYPPTTVRYVPNDLLSFSGAFYDANKNIIPGGTVTFGWLNFLPNPAMGNLYSMNSYTVNGTPPRGTRVNYYSSIAGTTQTVTINPTAGGSTLRTAPITGSLYVPSKMALKPADMQREVLKENYFYKFWSPMYGGTMDIVWWPDANNTKGVVITFEYDYDLSRQFHPGSPPSDRKYYRAFRVPDNGKFTVRFGEIAGIFPNATPPFNAIVTLTIGRANYAIMSSADGLEKYSVYAGSALETGVNITALGISN